MSIFKEPTGWMYWYRFEPGGAKGYEFHQNGGTHYVLHDECSCHLLPDGMDTRAFVNHRINHEKRRHGYPIIESGCFPVYEE